MPIFGRSDEELQRRESALQKKYEEIRTMLQGQQLDIEKRFHELGSMDASIMARSDLEKIYQEQVRDLEERRRMLDESIASFRGAATELAGREQELLLREQKVLQRECEAQSAFAAELESQMAPLNDYKKELDGKAALIIRMQEEFNKNYMAQNEKLLADFHRMKSDLQESFEQLQRKALEEREALSARENALNEREGQLAQREADVRQGLSAERARMMIEVEAENARLAESQQRLRQQEDVLQSRGRDLAAQEAALAERLTAIQNREAAAAGDFAVRKQEMVAEAQQEIHALRTAAQEQIMEMQRQAASECERMLQVWNSTMSAERERMLQGLGGELQQQRLDNEAARMENSRLRQELQSRETELVRRENQLRIAEETLNSRELFLKEKEEIFSGRIRGIADERIAAAQAEAQAAHQSRDEVAARLASVSMELEAARLAVQVASEPAPVPLPAIAEMRMDDECGEPGEEYDFPGTGIENYADDEEEA